MMRKFLIALLFAAVCSPALAGSGTVAYTPCASGCTTFQTTTNAGTNNLGNVTIWDYSAGANGWSIDGSHGGLVAGEGTAGTAAGGILTVQGVASMTPLLATLSGTNNINNISGTVSLPTGAATAANQSTEISSLSTIATNTGAAIPAGTNLIGNVGVVVPAGATSVQGSTTGTTAATSTTLAATASVTNYVCEISIRANATAAATGNATLSDGTKTFNFTQWTAPNASGVGVIEEIFNPCYPASAVNTAWTLTSAAPGTGGVVSVAIAGYQK